MSTLGDIIKKYRLSQNPELSIRKFAEKCNLSYSYISMLEKNKDPRGNAIIPTIATINKVAIAMDMDFDTLFNQLDSNYLIKVNATPDIEPLPYNKTEHLKAYINWFSKILAKMPDDKIDSLMEYAEYLSKKDKED